MKANLTRDIIYSIAQVQIAAGRRGNAGFDGLFRFQKL
jgi:hypothetical protein